MKYLLLIYSQEQAWKPEERACCIAESVQLTHRLHAAGQYLDASPLQSVQMATSVRVRDGKTLVTDGPFAETYEQLGGYYLIEAAHLDDAIRIAEQIPGARRGTVEIRPLQELTNLPVVNRAEVAATT